jgi:hypothetical protein
MRNLKILGILLPLGASIAIAPLASALSITQKSDQTVNGGYVTTCVDVKGSHVADGTPVGPYACNNNFNEEWELFEGQLRGIGSTAGNYKCLTAQNSSSGSPVILDACAVNNSNQIWTIQNNGQIVSKNGRCLDSQGYVGAQGQLVVNMCRNKASQIWRLK